MIDYATGWLVAKAILDAIEEVLGQFLHDNIFANYSVPKELISDNRPNLLAGAVWYYVNLLKSRHQMITPYHP